MSKPHVIPLPSRPAEPLARSGRVTVQRAVDLLFKGIEVLLAVMLVGMVLMVLGNVVLRYGFSTGIAASEELSRLLFVWITFLGAVIAMRENAHLGVDSLVVRLPRGGRIACVVVSEIVMLGCCGLLFWGTWQQHEVNATTQSLVTGMPMIWEFGVGYVASLGMGVLILHKLWRIANGRATDAELYQAANTDVQAHALPKGDLA